MAQRSNGMKALSLFTGIGGLDLAAMKFGIEVEAMCEIDTFCQQILRMRFPNVELVSDVKEVKGAKFETVDLVYGGFPCQDLSIAGRQKGLSGARSGLWYEMLRIIAEIRPRFVLGENVRGAINLALDTVIDGLESISYEVWPFCVPAAAFGAPHRRERLFILGIRNDVAYTYRNRLQGRENVRRIQESEAQSINDTTGFGGSLWPTPQNADATVGAVIGTNDKFVVKPNGTIRKINGKGTDGSLGLARTVNMWATPNTMDGIGLRSYEAMKRQAQVGGRKNRTRPSNLREQVDPLMCQAYDEAKAENNKEKLWPTPNTSDRFHSHAGDIGRHYLRYEAKTEEDKEKLWPTPRQFMYKDAHSDRGKGNLGEGMNGQLNADWVEQLMNFPEGWTDTECLETREWRGWPAPLGAKMWGTPASADCQGATGGGQGRSLRTDIHDVKHGVIADQYDFEFPRTIRGAKNRAARLKALGNAVVPAQAEPFFRAISEIYAVIKGSENDGKER